MKRAINWRAYVFALLCISTAAVLALSSVTMCKYTASAAVQASGTVAKWEVQLEGKLPPASNGIVKFSSTHVTEDFTVYVKNQSEVAAMPGTPVVTFGTSYGDMSFSTSYRATVTLTRTDGTGVLAPGGTATYKMTVSMPFGGSGCEDGYTTVNVKFTAVQVD